MQGHNGRRPARKSNGLVALSSAAVLTVYSAGYMRTRSEAERFVNDDARRPVVPAPATAGPAVTPRPIEAPPSANAAAIATPAAPTKPAETKTTKIDAPAPRRESVRPPSAPATTTPVAVTIAETAAAAPAPAAPAPASSQSAADVKSADLAAPAAAPAPQPQYKDGTYFGWGTSRHGDIQAYVVIEGGHITVAAIAQCLTRYSCSWIAHLPGQVIVRQSADVDYVTGATQSTNAFYYAIVEALSKAK